MGKTYVDIVKYLIKANLEVNGIVEKPDIVGAIFGQTEGLLGDELDLRELQKNGRIGRIEVETTVRGGKCVGSITIPSSLDMVETSILAAALEIVDRVGPCDAKIATVRIEDTRSLKRKQVLGRAKDLLKSMVMSEIPESRELSEMVRNELKVAEVGTFGPDALPCGPEVTSSDEIIVCEGRADVINLLRNGIKNGIAIGGANVGKTISDLCRKKEVTAFLDGDRGGDIILKELLHATEIDFVARAPPGREVEELARKEIIQALRRKVPIEQAGATNGGMNPPAERAERQEHSRPERDMRDRNERSEQRGERDNFRGRDAPRRIQPAMQVERSERVERSSERPPIFGERPSGIEVPAERGMIARALGRNEPARAPIAPAAQAAVASDSVAPEVAAKLRGTLKELEGSLKARIIVPDGSVASEVAIRDIMSALESVPSVQSVVLDGIITQRLLDLASEKGAKFVAGLRTGNIANKPATLSIVLAE